MKKGLKAYGIFLVLLLCLRSVTAQQPITIDNVTGMLESYVSNESPEKTYIQTDKDFYTNGDTIWFKTYLVDGTTHAKSDKSKVLHVELISAADSIVARRKLYVAQTATAGEIKLPENIEQGIYTLRVYTKYILDTEKPIFHEKRISVLAIAVGEDTTLNTFNDGTELQESTPEKISSPNLLFFPEGGHLVNGITSVVGIKATDENGTGMALKGTVLDEQDNLVAIFKTFDFGLGTLNFTPENGKTYNAHIKVNGAYRKYPMPKPLPKGYTLNIVDNDSQIVIRVTTNLEKGVQGTWLLGHMRGRSFMKRKIKSENSTYSLSFSKRDIPDGIAHFTLFSEIGEPLCERLLFVDAEENNIVITGKTASAEYSKRDRVSLQITARDINGKPVTGTMGVSVVSENSTLREESSTIKSWLLLNSDLGGTVPNADFFFDTDNKAAPYLLDALLLTHGWRRFVWSDTGLTDLNKKKQFVPEVGIMINGRTTSFQNKYQPRKSKLTLSILEKKAFQDVETTNAQGHFSFGPFVFTDSVKVHIVADPLVESKRTKENELAIYLDGAVPDRPIERKAEVADTTLELEADEEYLATAYRKKTADFEYESNLIQLDPATVSAKKKTPKQIINDEIQSLTLYGVPSTRIFPDSIPGFEPMNVFEFLMGAPGVTVVGTPPNLVPVLTRYYNPPSFVTPLLLLNGNPTDIRSINTLIGADIAFIDVLRSAGDTAMYGIRGAGGVISIYTKVGPFNVDKLNLGNEPENYPNFASFHFEGFSKVREFFSPDYTSTKPEHRR
ncbi:MAG: hypothetical protein WBB27_04110, partial [Maribacter sp.]